MKEKIWNKIKCNEILRRFCKNFQFFLIQCQCIDRLFLMLNLIFQLIHLQRVPSMFWLSFCYFLVFENFGTRNWNLNICRYRRITDIFYGNGTWIDNFFILTQKWSYISWIWTVYLIIRYPYGLKWIFMFSAKKKTLEWRSV